MYEMLFKIKEINLEPFCCIFYSLLCLLMGIFNLKGSKKNVPRLKKRKKIN